MLQARPAAPPTAAREPSVSLLHIACGRSQGAFHFGGRIAGSTRVMHRAAGYPDKPLAAVGSVQKDQSHKSWDGLPAET